jgi:LexA-binding, inner membrane-associated putative hydrolase
MKIMVMGPTHAMSGALGWLAGTAVLGATYSAFQSHSLPVIAMGTLITAGAALAPDIDSHSSTIVNSFGAAGKVTHKGVNALSVTVYNATATRRDKPRENGHRTLFHTTFMAILAGLATAFLTSLSGTVEIFDKTFAWGQISALAIMFIFTHLALAGLFEKQIKKGRRKYGPYVMMLVSLAVTLTTATLLPENDTYGWLGLAVGLGWFIHLLGDAITKMGVPLLFPFTWHKKRWWDVTLPSFLRITAGGTFEKVILLPVLTIATVLYLLYVIPFTHEAFLDVFPFLK